MGRRKTLIRHRPVAQFRIGQRVYVQDDNFLGKVVDYEENEHGTYYLVREFEHPHRVVWADEIHTQHPLEKHHHEEWRVKDE